MMRHDERQSSGELGEDFGLVPLYDVVASAGPGSAVDQEKVISQIAFRKDWLRQQGLNINSLAAITAHGESMEPTISEGALLLIDTSQRTVGGDAVYVLRRDGHLYTKRLQRLYNGSVRVSSDNPAYVDETVPPDQVDRLDIVGRVVWIGHHL